jgi:hypothetical protein
VGHGVFRGLESRLGLSDSALKSVLKGRSRSAAAVCLCARILACFGG